MATTQNLQQAPETRDKEPEQERPKHSPVAWVFFLVAILAMAALVFFFAWLPRHKTTQQLDKQAQERTQEKPKVNVAKVQRSSATSELMIPGTTLAYTDAYIYARASGYVTKRLVDIGDRVRPGQLLAVIDAPDLDKQVAQARSNLQQSESNLAQVEAQLHLAQVTWDRYKVLVAKGVLSRQEGDQQEANFRVAEANVHAAQNTVQGNRENLERLVVLQQYEHVTAPFAGVVTARNIDVGALISASGTGLGNSASSSTSTTQAGSQGNNQGASGNLTSSASPTTGGNQGGEMFSIAEIDRLRILVSVPEAYAGSIHIGQQAILFFQERSNEKIEGRVTRTSASIDQNSRTLLVEVQTPNRGGHLLPGMYVVVNFVDVKAQPPLIVRGESIVVRDAKTTVAVVKNNVVHFTPISIGRDYGDQTEVVSGLKEGDIIATTVTDEVHDGAEIDPQFPKQQAKKAQPSDQSDRRPGNEGQYGNQGLSNSSGKAAPSSGKSGKGGGSGSQGGSSGNH